MGKAEPSERREEVAVGGLGGSEGRGPSGASLDLGELL